MKYVFYGESVTFNEYINAERRNRFIAAKIKKTETETIASELEGNPKIAFKFDLEITHYVPTRRKDPDGFLIFSKFLLDGMQEAGIIENDGQEQVGRITQNEIKIDKDNPRIEVLITQHKE